MVGCAAIRLSSRMIKGGGRKQGYEVERVEAKLDRVG